MTDDGLAGNGAAEDGMAGDAVNGDNNTATDNNDGTVSGALGNGVRDLGEGVGDAVEERREDRKRSSIKTWNLSESVE